MSVTLNEFVRKRIINKSLQSQPKTAVFKGRKAYQNVTKPE